jgi:phosphomannomutase
VAVADRDMRDGVKHLLEDGSWVMVRPSGTEPVLRIYSEAADAGRAQALVEELVAMVHSLEKG